MTECLPCNFALVSLLISVQRRGCSQGAGWQGRPEHVTAIRAASERLQADDAGTGVASISACRDIRVHTIFRN
jgi:hypothetical protein